MVPEVIVCIKNGTLRLVADAIKPPSKAPKLDPTKIDRGFKLWYRARFCSVDISLRYTVAMTVNIPIPSPDSRRNPISDNKELEKNAHREPIPIVAIPPANNGLRPKYWVSMPPGRLIVSLPTGTIMTAMPTIVIPTPNWAARIGIDGAVDPCPSEFRPTHKHKISAALYFAKNSLGLNVGLPLKKVINITTRTRTRCRISDFGW